MDPRMSKTPRTVQAQLMPSDVKKALSTVAGSASGRKFLRWLMNYSGYKHSSLTMAPDGTLLVDAIVHNESKRATWLDIRKGIPAGSLNYIEKEDDVNDSEK